VVSQIALFSEPGTTPDDEAPAATQGVDSFGNDGWTRETQRLYLVNTARRAQMYRDCGDAYLLYADTENARATLLKLNGMEGQW
jgi:hypothetical protein